MGIQSGTEVGKDLPGEIEGEGTEEEGEELGDIGLLGLCPSLPNNLPALPTLDPSSSIFSIGILKLRDPGASADEPDNVS